MPPCIPACFEAGTGWLGPQTNNNVNTFLEYLKSTSSKSVKGLYMQLAEEVSLCVALQCHFHFSGPATWGELLHRPLEWHECVGTTRDLRRGKLFECSGAVGINNNSRHISISIVQEYAHLYLISLMYKEQTHISVSYLVYKQQVHIQYILHIPHVYTTSRFRCHIFSI